MTEPKITARLKDILMTSATSVYRRTFAAESAADYLVIRAPQTALDHEDPFPSRDRPPHDDVQ